MAESADKVPGGMVMDREVRRLFDACCDGYATDEQRAEMSQLIESSDEARDYVIAHSFMVSQLVAIAGSPQEQASLAIDPAARSRFHFSLPVRRFVAIAASVLVVLFGLEVYRQSSTVAVVKPGAPPVVGKIRRLADEGVPPGQFVSVSERTAIHFDDAEYEVMLNSGVALTLAGPGSFVMDNPMYCRLASGRLTATVPDGSEGFRVDTDDAEIIDHGTRFGVAVDPDLGTSVAVFEGKVEVLSGDEHRKLSIGRAISVNGLGLISRMQVVKPDSFSVPRKPRGTLGPAIVSVHDNIRSPEEMGYYRIVHEGFDEDQQAYVDRVHQWNGLDESGLPKELVGADYILPFNDDKMVKDIEITVTLARKADLYVVLDARVAPPNWLLHEFTRTDLVIGMDEGERPGRPEDLRRLGLGAGVSVDYQFSVWKRNQPAAGSVTLGGMPANFEFMSMYGILAVPILESLEISDAI